MPLKIPGYHWDEDAKRYFKIDISSGSRDSHWNRDNIKRRKKEKVQVTRLLKRASEKDVGRPARVRRSRQLAHPLVGGFLAREVFGFTSPATASARSQGFLLSGLAASRLWISQRRADPRIPDELGRSKILDGKTPTLTKMISATSSSLVVAGMNTGGKIPALDRDFQNVCLVSSYDSKGSFNMEELVGDYHHLGNLPCFWVSGNDERLGAGMIYATTDRTTVKSAYLPFNDFGRIDFKYDRRPARMRDMRLYQEQIRTPGISSIAYHDSTNRVIITSEGHDASCSVYLFNPTLNLPGDPGPSWLLGETDFYQRIAMQVDSYPLWWTNTNVIAPASSHLVCALGTNSGIVTFDGKDKLCPIIPSHLSPGEIFSLDFLPGHKDIILAGGRRGHVVLADLRLPPEKFEYSAIVHADSDWYSANDSLAKEGKNMAKTKSHKGRSRRNGNKTASSKALAISHVVGMNEHQVLVSGIKHKMCIYDIRWRKPSTTTALPEHLPPKREFRSSLSQRGARTSYDRYPYSSLAGQTTAPIVTFTNFRNNIHLQHGLAVSDASSSAVSGAGQIVAAAHDDGSVGLYSARTGRMIPCPAVDRLRGRGEMPVRCLQWQKMPRDTHESLWAGIGTEVVGVGVSWDETEGDEIESRRYDDGDNDDADVNTQQIQESSYCSRTGRVDMSSMVFSPAAVTLEAASRARGSSNRTPQLEPMDIDSGNIISEDSSSSSESDSIADSDYESDGSEEL